MWWFIICGHKFQVKIFNTISTEDILLDMVKTQTDICRPNAIKQKNKYSQIMQIKIIVTNISVHLYYGWKLYSGEIGLLTRNKSVKKIGKIAGW